MRLTKFFAPAFIALGLTTGAIAQDTTAPTADVSKPSVMPETAATYATYQGDVGDVAKKRFESKGDIEENLTKLGGHNTEKLTKGWMSYSALIAAQNREFATSIRDWEDYYGRAELLKALEENPAFIASFEGGDKAVHSALDAAKADQGRIQKAASFLKAQEEYLQDQDWIQERIMDSKTRVNELKSLARTGRPISASARQLFQAENVGALIQNTGSVDGVSLWDRASIVVSNAPGSALSTIFGERESEEELKYKVARTRAETGNHIASLAAYEIVDEANLSHDGMVNAISDRKTKKCFNMAQLQLRACVGNQSSHYGLQACLREHAISDIGNCVGGVAE